LAAQVFGLPVHLGHSQTVAGPTTAIESPEYSTAIGLVRYGVSSQPDQHQRPSPLAKMSHAFHNLVHKARTLF
jgi:cell division ATPase FtsA